MNMSTKALLAMLTVGGVSYGIHRYNKKRKAEESKKRREEKQKQAA